MVRSALVRWLEGPALTGRTALLCGIVAIALGTTIRASIDSAVTGCEFTPYLPFVLLSAVLLRWWQACLVALISVTVLGGLFIGSPHELLHSACFQSGAAIFLISSAALIGSVIIARRLFHFLYRPGENESAGGVIFSLEDGKVWASWYDQGPPVLIGSQEKVSAMMKDYLAQEEVGRRLNGRP